MLKIDQLQLALEDERPAFEAHMLNDFGLPSPRRDGNGYQDALVQLQWITWQAARALGVREDGNV